MMKSQNHVISGGGSPPAYPPDIDEWHELLCQVVVYAPLEYKERAWRRLPLEILPTRLLTHLYGNAPDPYREKTAEELATRYPHKRELLFGMLQLAQEFATAVPEDVEQPSKDFSFPGKL